MFWRKKMLLTANDFINSQEDIVEIIALNGYTCVHTIEMEKDDNRILCNSTLREWINLLPVDRFVQIDRSTIINFNYALLSGHFFSLYNGKTIRISNRRYSFVKKSYEQYQIKSIMKGKGYWNAY